MPFAPDPAVGCRPRSGAGRRYSPVIIVAAHTLGPHLLPAEMMGWNPPGTLAAQTEVGAAHLVAGQRHGNKRLW